MKILNLLKKKSALAGILALCIVFSTFTAVLADEGEAADKINTSGSEVIPVHGHVGPHAVIIPPDPDDPDGPPLTDTEIYVEVPVRILFVAFDSDGGAVTSPRYKITNLSETSDVKVEIADFTQRNAPDAELDNQLSLRLVTLANEALVSDLFPADYSSAKLVKENLPKSADGSSDNVLDFMIGGAWSGSFDKEIKPIFDMTVKFSGAK